MTKDQLSDWLLSCQAAYRLSNVLPSLTFSERVTVAQLKSLSHDQLVYFGFVKWDSTLVLLPLYVLGLVSNGETLEGIFGTQAVVGQHYIDDDTRKGAVAWGFRQDS